MREIIEKLNAKEIINKNNIAAIRNYIEEKYPDITPQRQSIIFADSVNKIIDKNISQFDESHRINIRKNIIRKAVMKNSFVINAEEIFRECIKSALKDEKSIENLTEWLNNNLNENVEAARVKDFIQSVQKSDEKDIDEAINRALNIDEYETSCEVPKINEVIEEPVRENEDYLKADNKEKDGTETFDNKRKRRAKYILKNKRSMALLTCTAIVSLTLVLNGFNFRDTLDGKNIGLKAVYAKLWMNSRNSKSTEIKRYETLLDAEENKAEELNYIDVDKKKLKNWLDNKNSLLAEEPYLSCILNSAKKFNVNPLLLVAITGQEQNFVPKNHKQSKKMINNPYNVFGSWIEYNTNFQDATEIAARTIVTLRKDKPDNVNSIKWINRKYAEDKNWWIGVSRIFNQLKRDIRD